jgi:hypothetical protein
MDNTIAATSIKLLSSIFTQERCVEKQSGQERLTAIFNSGKKKQSHTADK